jgi:large subunit ribosomal protein L28e
MVAIPSSLAWELVKNNHCFLVKKSGRCKSSRSGMVEFSTEPGNLRSINRYKYSGIAQQKSVGIAPTEDGEGAEMVLGTKKAATQPVKGEAVVALNKNYRSCEKTIIKEALKDSYRPDLAAAALAKYSVTYDSIKRVTGSKKKVPVKMGRKPKHVV